MPLSKNFTDPIDAVIQTRKISEEIAAKVLGDIDGKSESQVAEELFAEMKNRSEIFPTGWYDPPPGGVSILFDEAPFERLKFDSLRNSKYWPNKKFVLKKETVGQIYFSPVDKKTGMMGDLGFTIYRGDNEEIMQHLKKCYDSILEIARHAQIGMKVSELCSFANNLFKNKLKMTRWVPISSDPNQSINLGHSITGSFESNFILPSTFEEIKETLRTKRVPIIDTENFEFLETCAFIIESRLEDFNKPYLPSAYFQFFVCFDNGKKIILDNFSEIFRAVGMDYMKGEK